MNTQQKPFDNPKVRQAINYAINKEALAKVAFAGYAMPAEGVVPQGVDYAAKLGPWPYDPAKARAAAEGSRLSERLRDHAVVRVQPHDRAEGDPVRAAAARAGRHQGAGAGARSRPARREGRERAGPGHRAGAHVLRRAGRRRPAKPTGRCVRCWRRSRSRRSCSTPRTTRTTQVDADIKKALRHHRPRREGRSSTTMRRSASGTTRRGPSW